MRRLQNSVSSDSDLARFDIEIVPASVNNDLGWIDDFSRFALKWITAQSVVPQNAILVFVRFDLSHFEIVSPGSESPC